ncbi:hypothetical protein WMY93_021668 [Mugilogobius chulae]|uniref:Cyclin-dependent kinase inhibitor domain-containing protein n=1 Tax=Mugilogobius chulae TaxID=88201 RepID=A0AAW0NNI7_9GOBI
MYIAEVDVTLQFNVTGVCGRGAKTKRDANLTRECVSHLSEKEMAATAKIFDLLLKEKSRTSAQRRARATGLEQSGARDLTMASSSTSTSASSEMELTRSGGIEALRLKVGPVRRNLFGPVDHQQLQQDFQRVLRMGVEVANKRWNFDFQRDEPGPGPVEWEELSFQEVPAFYRSCMVRPARSAAGTKRRSSSSSGEGSPVSSSSSSSEEEYIEVTTRECYRLQSGKRKQAIITDFYKVKRRRLLNYKESSRQ